ncbi:MAG TPA: hypothetical protein VK054_13090, partial [Beutenbergiaceae bacterium]|nr:hypothetical protein [Beutenbergiaceae bacterium]
ILQTSPGPYFDGDFSLQDGTTAWSGTPGESPSSETVDLGSEVVVWENLVENPSWREDISGWRVNNSNTVGYRRTASFPQMWEGAGRQGSFICEFKSAGISSDFHLTFTDRVPVTVGEWYAWTALMAHNSTLEVTCALQFYNSSGTSMGSVLPDEGWRSAYFYAGRRFTGAVQAPAGAVDARLVLWARTPGGSNTSEGATCWADAVQMSPGADEDAARYAVSQYFDSTMSFDPDLTPQARPGGGSQLVGQQVAGVSAVRGVVVQSSQWSKSGGVSARFITTVEATGNSIPAGVVSVFGPPVGGFVMWRRQEATIGEFEFPTGASNLSVMFATGEASDPAVNAPGETLMRVELEEVFPTGGQVYLPGGGNVGDSVWFDILTVTDESYDGPPFSGSSPTEGPKWLPGSGNSGCKFVGNPTWIANSGVNGGQIGYAATLKEVGDWQL